MEKILSFLDKSMSDLALELLKHPEDNDSPRYQKILATLAALYQAFNSAYDLAAMDCNNKNISYLIAYANMQEIGALLANAGYLEESKKTVSR